MISASKVRDIQLEAVSKCILSDIEERIHKAISSGQFCVQYTFRHIEPMGIRNNVISKLRDLGYSVKPSEYTLDLLIRWNDEREIIR